MLKIEHSNLVPRLLNFKRHPRQTLGLVKEVAGTPLVSLSIDSTPTLSYTRSKPWRLRL